MFVKTLVFLGLACAVMGVPVVETHPEETNRGVTSSHGKSPVKIFLTPRHYILDSDISKYLAMYETHHEYTDRESTHNTEVVSRVRRSPQTSARLDVNAPMWTSDNGRHQLQGNAFYQRNWNTPGPRQDYGGNVQYTYRIPG